MGKDNQLDMLLRKARRLRVGGCEADLALNEVHGEGGRVARLTPKAAGVLEVLLYTAGQPVSKERLLAEVWRGEFPTEDVVTHAIGELRRAFGDDTRAPRYIRTLARVGYALIAEVGPLLDPAPATSADQLPDAPQTLAGPSPAPVGPPVGASAPAAAAVPPAAVGPPAGRRWLPAVAAIGIGIASVLVALAWLPHRPPLAARPALQPSADGAAVQPEAVTSMPGSEMFPVLSPDASLLAFSAATTPMTGATGLRIHLQVPGDDNPRQLTQAPADNEFYPVFSPDGQEVLLQRVHDDRCRFIVASVLGGVERDVGQCSPRLVTHVSWTPDGSALLLPRLRDVEPPVAALYRLDLASGEQAQLDYPTSDEASDVQARYSPDGSLIAFRRGAMPHSDLHVMAADGSGLRQLTALHAQMPGFDWTPDGRALVFASNHEGSMALYRVALDDGSITALGVERAWWPDVAALREEMVFVREASALQVARLSLDGALDAEPVPVAPSSRSHGSPRYSPDGTRVALVSEREGESALLLVQDGATRRLAEHSEGTVTEPRWSADGRELLYVLRGGGSRLYALDVDSGRRRDITPAGHTVMSAAFSPDRQAIVFSSDMSGRWELWWLDREDGAVPRQLTHGGARHPEFRDPQRLVYVAGLDMGSLHELDLVTGEDRDLGCSVAFWNQRAWQVADDGIYALHGIGETGIYRRSWDGGEWTLVEPLGELQLGENLVSLHLPSRQALVTISAERQGDIYRLQRITP